MDKKLGWWNDFLTEEDKHYKYDYIPRKEDMCEGGYFIPPGFACLVEYLHSDFDLEQLPFDDHLVQLNFPVLKNTKYARVSCEINPKWVSLLGEVILDGPWYENKISKLINLPVKKEMFKEHSLFLLKEHLKLFSSYSEKAKQLLDVINAF